MVEASENDAIASIALTWRSEGQGYQFFVDQDEVTLMKFYDGATSFAYFFYENRPLKNVNLEVWQ